MSLPPLMDANFESPETMLYACHDKLRTQCELMIKLEKHLKAGHHDDDTIQATKRLLKYFETAAIHHHEDEEIDVYPALKRLGLPTLNKELDRLTAQHRELESRWRKMRKSLLEVLDGVKTLSDDAVEFTRFYLDHAEHEDRLAFPFIRQLSEATRVKIGQAMQQRRMVPINENPNAD